MLDGGRYRCNSDLEGSTATGLRWQRHGADVLRVLALKATRCRRALVGLEMGRPPGSTGEPPRSQELCRRRLRVD